MSLSESAVLLGGAMMLVVGVFHTTFDRRFDLKGQLPLVRADSRKVLYTIHIGLTLVFFLLGFVSLRHAEELARPGGLGASLSLGLAALWAWRTVWQVVYFRPSARQRERWRYQLGLVAFGVVITTAYATPSLVALLARS